MAADLATLAIQVDAERATAQVLQFGQASVKAAEQTGVLEATVGTLEKTMSRVRTLFGLGLFGFEFLKETIDAQDAMAQLEAGVRSTGMAAGFTAEQLGAQAQALQRVTTYSDETIMKGQGVLLMFQRIGGANFQRAIQASADLATRLGGDVPEAARTLGRALEDPAQGLMMLRRAGVVFSEGQKAMLVDLVNTGHAEEAQTKILDLLQQRLGGSAAAARDTLGGALKALMHDFGDLFEVTRSGSNPVVEMIDKLDAGVNVLKDHMDALVTVAQTLATVYVARLAAGAGAYVAAQVQMIRGTIMAAEAEVAHTEAMTAKAVELRLLTELEVLEATAAAREAEIHLGCAYSEADEAAAVAELAAAKASLIAANEAALAATIAVTDAQLAEATAATVATATTTAMGVAMGIVTRIATAMWTAIGGPIGAVVLAIVGLVYAYHKLRDAIKGAHEAQTAPLAKDPALEQALVAQNAAAAKAQRDRDDQADALLAAQKANAERDASREKLEALNGAYDRSSLSLKLYGIELDANVEKVKAHKGVVQAEWAEIDKSIDAMTRAQIEAAKLDFRKNSDQNLRDLQASNEAMIQSAQDAATLSDAQEGVAVAQMLGARAGIEAQKAYEHLNVELQTNAKIEAARVQLQKAVVGATQDEIDAANAYYDEQVKGIEAERQIRDATIDRTQALEDLKSAMHGFGDLMDMISGKSTASLDSIADAVKNLMDTIHALAQSGSLQDAIGVLTGQGTPGSSPNDIFKLPSAGQAKLGRIAAGIGQGVGMAGAGFGIGQMAAQNISNPFLAVGAGTLGGAASGAAMGATMGGPIGAVAGGIIGAASGLIGSFVGLHKSASELAAAERARVLAEAQVAASLADWRAQITGTAEDQRKAAEQDLRLKYLQMVQTIEQTEAGKKMEQQRNKDLADAADLYKMAQHQLTESTKKLNDEFSQMVNAVSGYRLNLQLFNFSKAYGPPESSSPSTPTNGSGSGGNGGGNGRDDGTESSLNRVLQIHLNVDGRTLAQSTVRYVRKVAVANTGDSSNIVEGFQLING